MNTIKVRGARQHNLKNVNIDIPKNSLVVFTGPSGSGKSSMAMDTIYAEGQRRYVESLSSYARQFLGVMDKPDVEFIEGLSPAIAIDQKTTSHNPRSTVGTTTEIYDYFRLLFARVGHPHCPNCGKEITTMSVDQIMDKILNTIKENLKVKKVLYAMILSPVVKDRKGEFSKMFENLSKQGFSRVRVDGAMYDINDDISIIKTNKHTIDVVVERFVFRKETFQEKQKDLKTRLTQAVENALSLSGGNVLYAEIPESAPVFPEKPKLFNDTLYSEKFACPDCNIALAEMEPRLFSFNSPHGACPGCDGLGLELKIDEKTIINSSLSIAEGGIFPWADLLEKNTWFRRLLEAVAQEEKMDLYTPIKNMSAEKLGIILRGGGEKVYQVSGPNRFGKIVMFEENFEGVIPNLERRYKETESDYVKSEIEKYMIKEDCPECGGTRLNKRALSVTIDKKSIAQAASMSIHKLYTWLYGLYPELVDTTGLNNDYIFPPQKNQILSKSERKIANPVLREIAGRLKFLIDVGLDYLTLSRSSATLAGGEAQRIRLASQIGSGLSGVLYVLDEPSIGLHYRDHTRLINTLKHLRDLDNTILVVEHDDQVMRESDYIFDFGPKAGDEGGEVVAQGTPKEIMKNPRSLTGQYLASKKIVQPDIHVENGRYRMDGKTLTLLGAREHNLKNLTVTIPLNKFIVVTGVSGSGKSTLVNDTLLNGVRRAKGMKVEEQIGEYDQITGVSNITQIINIDQSPIGKTPRSNPVTYTKTFDYVRAIFAKTEESRVRGYNPGRFSFNVKGGRCEACQGDGQLRIEMQFMPDIYIDCEVCGGKRYNSEALEIEYKGKNISEVLDMTVLEALSFFGNIPQIERRLRTLADVGLGYIKLGQPAPTLSGGEAQRVKLASELSKSNRGHTLYVLDEPTTGLHFSDLERLISIIKRIVAKGNTVIVVEHNLDVIKNSDWIIDLGPEGGDRGGEVIAEGTPEDIVKIEKSYTGKALKQGGRLRGAK